MVEVRITEQQRRDAVRRALRGGGRAWVDLTAGQRRALARLGVDVPVRATPGAAASRSQARRLAQGATVSALVMATSGAFEEHMTVPGFQDFMLPILKALADGTTRPWREVAASVAEQLHLTSEERSEALPNGKLIFENRAARALTHLYQAGLISRPTRGFAAITAGGQETLAERPERIDMAYLSRFATYQEFRSRHRERADDEQGSDVQVTPSGQGSVDATPGDLMAAAERENRAGVEAEVLDKLFTLEPTTFERLMLQVLTSLGCGGRSQAIEHTGRIGDGGIDGIIRQDPLGLERVYMQAKRYAANNLVGLPDIQSFVGALHGQQADRGVFITTSSYSRDAAEYVRYLSERIVLIDGRRLASLMVLNNVGVQDQQTFTLKRLDEDFFDAL